MPKWLKVVLIIMGAGVLLVGTCAGAAAWWFNANKDRLAAVGQKAKTDGEVFGKGTNGAGCLTESLRRLDASKELMQRVELKMFLGACLKAAAPDPSVCEGAPPRGEIMKSVEWVQGRCTELGVSPNNLQACGGLMQAVQEHCATH